MQIDRNQRRYSLKMDSKITAEMRGCFNFSSDLKRRFNSMLGRVSRSSRQASSRGDIASFDVSTARDHGPVSIFIFDNPLNVSIDSLDSDPRTPIRCHGDFCEGVCCVNKSKLRKSPSVEALHNFPGTISLAESNDVFFKNLRQQTITNAMRPITEESSVSNFSAVGSYVNEESATLRIYRNSESSRNSDDDTDQGLKNVEDEVFVPILAEKRNEPIKNSSDSHNGAEPLSVQDTNEVEQQSLGEGTPKPRQRLHKLPSALNAEDYDWLLGPSAPNPPVPEIPPVNVNIRNANPPEALSVNVNVQPIGPPEFQSVNANVRPVSPVNPVNPVNPLAALLESEVPQPKKKHTIFSSSSSEESSEDGGDVLNTENGSASNKPLSAQNRLNDTSQEETEEPVVVLRDSKRLSPRAISRDLSAFNAVDSNDDFETMIDKQKEFEKSIAIAAEEIKKKSIFESDSDDDLFKPAVTLKGASAAAAATDSSATSASNARVVVSEATAQLSTPITAVISLPTSNAATVKPETIDPDAVVPKAIVQSHNPPLGTVKNSLWMSSDSDESLFKSEKVATSVAKELFKPAAPISEKVTVTKKLFSDDSEDEDLFRAPVAKNDDTTRSVGEMTTRAPGKLDVSAFGRKLNNILLGGPPGPKKSALPTTAAKDSEAVVKSSTVTKTRVPGKLDTSGIGGKLTGLLNAGPPGMQKPKIAKVADETTAAAPVDTTLSEALKSRPRGPANRRPPTRSVVLAPSVVQEAVANPKPVKKSQSEDEIIDPLHF